MKEFFPVIRSAPLFSGISEEELTVMLSCLRAEKRVFPKGVFVLRAGDTADSIGLVLSGTVLVIQEDIWGNRNILSKAGLGQTFAASATFEQRASGGDFGDPYDDLVLARPNIPDSQMLAISLDDAAPRGGGVIPRMHAKR